MSLAIRGAGCTYPANRPTGICGHRAVRVYIGRGGLEWRCTAHDGPGAEAEAIRLGYKAQRIAALDYVTEAPRG